MVTWVLLLMFGHYQSGEITAVTGYANRGACEIAATFYVAKAVIADVIGPVALCIPGPGGQ